MLNRNEKGRTMLRKLSLVLAVAALTNSLTAAVKADAQNASDAPTVPPSATVVGRELVYPDGSSVSLDAGTGLSPNEATGLSSQAIDLDSVPRATVIPCSRGYVCLYQNINYGGRRIQMSRPGRYNLSRRYRFTASSWYNRTARDARGFSSSNFRPPSFCMNPGSRGNNKISSLIIYTTSRACN